MKFHFFLFFSVKDTLEAFPQHLQSLCTSGGGGCKKRSGHQLGFTVRCPVAAALGAAMGSKVPMGTGKTQELNPFPH